MRMKFIRILAGVCFVLLMSCLLSGCPSKPGDLTTTSEGLTKVTLALNWFPEIEHGGFYAAQLNGHYRDAGLEVEILPGGPNAPVSQRVGTRQVTFGVSSADRMLQARDSGADLVAVLAALQHSPRCLLVHPESLVKSFEDLHDVTLAVNESDPYTLFLKSKLALKNVRIVPYTGSIANFLLDSSIVVQGYTFSEPILAEDQGVKPRLLTVSELGYDPYNSLLITHRELISTKPDLVAKMRAATRLGWEDYLNDPDAVHEHLQTLNPEMTLDVMTRGYAVLKGLCQMPEESVEFGRMNAERWETLHHQLKELGLLQEGYDVKSSWLAEE